MKDVKKIKSIIFDLDNTLIDFMKMKERATDSAIEAMIDSGLPMKKEEARKIVNKLYEKFGIEYQKIFDEVLKEVLGKIDYKILAAGVVAYRKIKEGYVEPYPHVTSTLTELIRRGYDLGIITDAPAFQAWTRLVGMNLQHFFNFVIAFEETAETKPNEMPFNLALTKLELKPKEIMMVGDNPMKDVAGANRIGMFTVLAKYGQVFRLDKKMPEQKPDFEIDDIQDLLKILPKKSL